MARSALFALFANFIAEHPFSTANHFSRLAHVIRFLTAKVARAFKSTRTKTTCIVKHALNPHFIQRCQNGCYAMNTAANREEKHLAILVRLWDDDLCRPVTNFLHMHVCNVGCSAFYCAFKKIATFKIKPV